mmetsp:Transcript_48573/g.93817  ORF Transcript_48573/g.93817 Transcript_48573/m.93817 type:complete len:181 (+) Transcript_48573:25-567(+)
MVFALCFGASKQHRRRCHSVSLLAMLATVSVAACSLLCHALSFTVPPHLTSSRPYAIAAETDISRRTWGTSHALQPKATGRNASVAARQVFGLGTSEILVILAVGAIFFGPEALKGFAKEAGKAAADLKDVPKAFEEGMETASASKAIDVESSTPKKEEDSTKPTEVEAANPKEDAAATK